MQVRYSLIPAIFLAQFSNALADEDQIIISATRAESRLNETPLSVEVINEEDFAAYGYTQLSDVLGAVPGVQAVQNGPVGSSASVFIRGADSDHTLTLYDGIRLNDPAVPNGFFNAGADTIGDASRVEVVRGSASAIYGSDAIGGVINVIPARGAERAFAPSYEVQVGEQNSLRVVARAQGSFDGVDYGVSYDHLQTDGYDIVPKRISTHTGDPDGARLSTFSFNARYALNSSWSLEGLYRQRQGQNDFDTFSGGASGFQLADDPDLRAEQNDLTVARVGLLHEGLQHEARLRIGMVQTDYLEMDGAVITGDTKGKREFIEYLGLWHPNEGLSISYGGQVEQDQTDAPVTFNNPFSAKETYKGVFAVVQKNLENLKLSAALRYDDFEDFGAQSTWSAGAVADLPIKGGQIFANYGTSYNIPTLTERFAVNFFNIGNPNLTPETGKSWQVGLRYANKFSDEIAVRAGALWFDTEIEDLIIYDFFQTKNINAGKADIKGAEVYAGIEILEQFSIDGSYTNTDAINATTNAPLLRRPQHSATLQANWRATERLNLATTAVYTGARFDVTYDDIGFFSSGNEEVSDFTLVSLAARLKIHDHYELFTTVNNAFDKTYEHPAAFAGSSRVFSMGVRGEF